MQKNNKNSFAIDNRLQLLAIFLLTIVAVPSLVFGWRLIKGSDRLGFETEVLQTTPFNDFVLPGILLFSLLGVLSVFVGIRTFFEMSWYKELIVCQGLLLMGWLTIEILFGLPLSHWHFPFLTIGLFLIVLGVLLNVGNKIII